MSLNTTHTHTHSPCCLSSPWFIQNVSTLCSIGPVIVGVLLAAGGVLVPPPTPAAGLLGAAAPELCRSDLLLLFLVVVLLVVMAVVSPAISITTTMASSVVRTLQLCERMLCAAVKQASPQKAAASDAGAVLLLHKFCKPLRNGCDVCLWQGADGLVPAQQRSHPRPSPSLALSLGRFAAHSIPTTSLSSPSKPFT